VLHPFFPLLLFQIFSFPPYSKKAFFFKFLTATDLTSVPQKLGGLVSSLFHVFDSSEWFPFHFSLLSFANDNLRHLTNLRFPLHGDVSYFPLCRVSVCPLLLPSLIPYFLSVLLSLFFFPGVG